MDSKKRRKRQPAVIATCAHCGEQFKTTVSQIRVGKGRYCSMACSVEGRKKTKTVVPCRQCGKELILSPWELKRRKNSYGNFCSHECYGKWRSENLSGENAPHWKGGGKNDYGQWYWKRQRELARERDDNTCQGCGKVVKDGRALDVHHIVPYDNFDDPKDAHDLKNLVCLCRKCHMKRHKQ